MAVAGYLLGGALLGIGLSALTNSRNSSSASNYQASVAQYQPSAVAQQAAEPIDVAATETGITNNNLMEEERQKELAAAALRQQQNSSILTSGLGVTGTTSTQKKGLLGG